MINIEVGNQFKISETGEFIRIVSIDKKPKDAVFTVAYYSKRPQFTTTRSHIERHLNFNSWIKVKI